MNSWIVFYIYLLYLFIYLFVVYLMTLSVTETIQGVKKGLQVLRGYRTHLNEQNIPSQHMFRNQCLLRYGRCSCDLYSRCSVWFTWISTQLSAHRHTEVRTLSKISGLTRISCQIFTTRCCNTPKSFIGAEYTKVFRCPHSQKSRGLKSGDHASQLTGPLSPVHCSLKSGSGALWQWRENEVMPHDAWTTCVANEEAHTPRVLVNHSPKNGGRLHLLVC
jgi:hypothetical protein